MKWKIEAADTSVNALIVAVITEWTIEKALQRFRDEFPDSVIYSVNRVSKYDTWDAVIQAGGPGKQEEEEELTF